MAFVLADRVKETSVSVGTGAMALGGAALGFRAFSSAMAATDTTIYAIEMGANFEIGVGTYNANNTLGRTSVLASSNNGALVSFPSGTKSVFMTSPAQHLAKLNGPGTKVTTYTASGTHAFDPLTTLVEVIVLGAGGSGGPAEPNGAANASAGAGGSAGGMASKTFLRGSIASATVSVGAGGAASGTGSGNAGSSSSYSDGANSLTGNGGAGGVRATGVPNVIFGAGLAGGTAAGGDLNITGQPGEPATAIGASSSGVANLLTALGGNGAASTYGSGGTGGAARSNNGSADGNSGGSASGYGAGGGGGAFVASTASRSGGAGAPGLVIIREYR